MFTNFQGFLMFKLFIKFVFKLCTYLKIFVFHGKTPLLNDAISITINVRLIE